MEHGSTRDPLGTPDPRLDSSSRGKSTNHNSCRSEEFCLITSPWYSSQGFSIRKLSPGYTSLIQQISEILPPPLISPLMFDHRDKKKFQGTFGDRIDV
ncbi:hypothetical protein RRG08_015962 [Elysia crispata]|uniref:Uncharacterized protein n=1 Tax=Elysia crispata TaxID=231223 RepID=A0AAE1AT06_9GAST|nr:hypothetical protein RRG08_015962 [Elysia crispata]